MKSAAGESLTERLRRARENGKPMTDEEAAAAMQVGENPQVKYPGAEEALDPDEVRRGAR